MKDFPVFSIVEIDKRIPNFDPRRLVEWQQKGYVLKLRNRFYSFSEQLTNKHFEVEKTSVWRNSYDIKDDSQNLVRYKAGFIRFVANNIYTPSYISLETALSSYGFITDDPFQITSCSTRKTEHITSYIGYCTYRRIKPFLYFGYRLEPWSGTRYAIAEPEKAIIDYLYLHPAIQGTGDFNALQWNLPRIKTIISHEKLIRYESYINSKALSHRLRIFKTYLYAGTQ